MSAQAVTPVLSGQDVVLLTAPFFIGSLLNYLLLGTLVVQVYLYSISYPQDRVGIKVVVYGVFILDVIQTVFATHLAWGYLISGWGNPAVLFQPPWSLTALSFMGAIIPAIVQIFFAWRIWMLKQTLLARGIAVLIVLVALTQSISILVSSIRLVLSVNRVATGLSSISSGFITGVAGSFAADALIAGCQIVILSQARSKSPFKKTETVVTKLIVHTVQTAAVTALASLVWLILYTTMPNNFVSLTTVFMIGKLYSNVLMANLNARLPESTSISTEKGTYPVNSIVQITTDVTTDTRESSGDGYKPRHIEETSFFP